MPLALRRRPRRRHFSVQGRIVLVGSLVLWLGGTLLFLWTERNGALAQQSPGRQLLMAFFQSVTCRTAGFDVFAQGLLSPAGTLGSLLLMFIGAAPGSTGGGVKVSTVILVLLLLRGYFAGRIRVDVAGRSVAAYRYGAVLIGTGLAGIGGAFLTLAHSNQFVEGITSGRGFIALAVVVFARWSPLGAFVVSLLFGLFYALQLQLQAQPALNVPYQALQMLPYVMTIVALVMVRKGVTPTMLGVPYNKA